MANKYYDARNAYVLTVGIGMRPANEHQGTDNESLAITAADATRVAKELEKRLHIPNENISNLCEKDATKDNLLKKLDFLVDKTKEQPAEMVIIYFSGHGQEEDNKYYLVCYDTVNNDMPKTAIAGGILAKKLQEIKSEKVLVLLDCCHSGGFAQPIDIPFDEDDKKAFRDIPNRAIISASHASKLSYVSTPYSTFTYALIEGLAGKYFENKETDVNLLDLAMYIRERVWPLSEHTQRPYIDILKDGSTTNFNIVTYPNGEPRAAAFSSDFVLLNEAGKAIGDRPVEPDPEYRAQFNLIMNVSGTNNIAIQALDGDVNVVATYYTTTIIYPKADADRPYNQYLTKKLLTAIADYNTEAKECLVKFKGNDKWNSVEENCKDPRNYIISSYVGIIGIELRKLMGIGREKTLAQSNMYVNQCINTGKRTLQLICYTLIADGWKQIRERRQKDEKFKFVIEYREELHLFFTCKLSSDMSIKSYFLLFKHLHEAFRENEFTFHMDELGASGFSDLFGAEHPFYQACEVLNELNTMPEENKNSAGSVNDAEINVANLLAPLGFLALYNMASVKNINYEHVISKETRYLHTYQLISDKNSPQTLTYTDNIIHMDSVLIYKDGYTNGIGAGVNLFPFVIDYNGLNFDINTMKADIDTRAKIFFYTSHSTIKNKDTGNDEDTMKYDFLEDNEEQKIIFSDIIDTDATKNDQKKINKLITQAGNRKAMKLDGVFVKFKEATAAWDVSN